MEARDIFDEITYSAEQRDDHWVVVCDQTKVHTYGDTREEAHALNENLHQYLLDIGQIEVRKSAASG